MKTLPMAQDEDAVHTGALRSCAQSALGAESPIALSDVGEDDRLVAMWLHGRSAHTVRAYQRDVTRFQAFVPQKQLRAVTLRDLQAFADTLTGADSSRGRVLAAAPFTRVKR
jgi:Phage integrase, N-terminal SAM-like domain